MGKDIFIVCNHNGMRDIKLYRIEAGLLTLKKITILIKSVLRSQFTTTSFLFKQILRFILLFSMGTTTDYDYF